MPTFYDNSKSADFFGVDNLKSSSLKRNLQNLNPSQKFKPPPELEQILNQQQTKLEEAIKVDTEIQK